MMATLETVVVPKNSGGAFVVKKGRESQISNFRLQIEDRQILGNIVGFA